MLCCCVVFFVVVVCCYVETVRKAHSAQSFLQEAAYPFPSSSDSTEHATAAAIAFGVCARTRTSAKPLTISCLPNSSSPWSPRIIPHWIRGWPRSPTLWRQVLTAFAHRVSLPMSAVNVENRTAEWCVSVNIAPYGLSFAVTPAAQRCRGWRR